MRSQQYELATPHLAVAEQRAWLGSDEGHARARAGLEPSELDDHPALVALGTAAVIYEERSAIVLEAGDVNPLRAHEIAMHETITADQLRLRVIYAVPAQERTPRIVGKVRCEHNEVRMELCVDILEQISNGYFRPFLFLAERLERWPELPVDLAQRRLETSIWANPLGKLVGNRDLVFHGWPLSPDLVLLKPAVSIDQLVKYDHKMSGFVTMLPEGAQLSTQGDRDPAAEATARDRVSALMLGSREQWVRASEISSPSIGGSEGLRRLRELRALWAAQSPPVYVYQRRREDSTEREYMVSQTQRAEEFTA